MSLASRRLGHYKEILDLVMPALQPGPDLLKRQGFPDGPNSARSLAGRHRQGHLKFFVR